MPRGPAAVPCLLLLRGLVALSMACIMPLLQAVVAEHAAPEHRGRCFAVIGFCTALGSILSQLLGTALSNVQVGRTASTTWNSQG